MIKIKRLNIKVVVVSLGVLLSGVVAANGTNDNSLIEDKELNSSERIEYSILKEEILKFRNTEWTHKKPVDLTMIGPFRDSGEELLRKYPKTVGLKPSVNNEVYLVMSKEEATKLKESRLEIARDSINTINNGDYAPYVTALNVSADRTKITFHVNGDREELIRDTIIKPFKSLMEEVVLFSDGDTEQGSIEVSVIKE